jgi:hypothetical protein
MLSTDADLDLARGLEPLTLALGASGSRRRERRGDGVDGGFGNRVGLDLAEEESWHPSALLSAVRPARGALFGGLFGMLVRIRSRGARRCGMLFRIGFRGALSGDLDMCKERVVDPGLFALELDDSEGRTVSVGLGDLERGCPCRSGGCRLCVLSDDLPLPLPGGCRLCVLSDDLPLPLPGISPSATSDMFFRPNRTCLLAFADARAACAKTSGRLDITTSSA